jgi:hypothetical protein
VEREAEPIVVHGSGSRVPHTSFGPFPGRTFPRTGWDTLRRCVR